MYELIRCAECDLVYYEDRFKGHTNTGDADGSPVCMFCVEDWPE